MPAAPKSQPRHARRRLARVRPWLRAAAVTVRPWVGRALRGCARGLRHTGRWAVRSRRPLTALASRALWWTALWLLAWAGVRLLGWQVTEVDDGLWIPFAVGVGACALLALLAPERHLRWLATGLGTAHGAFAMLAWAAIV